MASQGKRMVPEYLIKALENLFKSDLTVKITVGSINNITSEDLNSLECGDIVLKEDSTGKHAYVVSYKSEEGLCLTYTDASIVETVSYDYTGGEWVYNSTDITPIAEPLMENIIDSAGNKRFIEGDIDLNTITGFTASYGKWSLSGSHLMIVLAGELDESVLTDGTKFADITIPKYILDKIYTVWGVNIAVINVSARNSSWASQAFNVVLSKSSTKLTIGCVTNITITGTKYFRVQFDLLIDAD